jgi:ABC-2 type transport system permease protein
VVAQLLRLKLRLFANGFRRPLGAIIVSGLGLAIAIAVVLVVTLGAGWLHGQDDAFVRRVVIIWGSYLTLAAFLLPFMLVRRELLDPRALRGYRFRSWTIAIVILVFSLIGPMLLIAPIAWAPTWAWDDLDAVQIAQIAAPILFVQGVLSVRLGVAAGAGLENREKWSRRVRAIGAVLLIVGIVPVIASVLPRLTANLPAGGGPRLFFVGLIKLTSYVKTEQVADGLEWTPLGALWAAPAHVVLRAPSLAPQSLWIGGITAFVLLVLWFFAVRLVFRPTRRIPAERRGGTPGWFRRLPSSPTGAIAARAFTYWIRDPRYRAVLGFLPFIPVVTVIACFIGGLPIPIAALIPLPLMVILLAVSTTHNDVAYDSTAVWTHVAAQTRGTHDRTGRLIPVLALGGLLIVAGTPLTVWGNGDPAVTPVVLGVGLSLLLGGIGVSSGLSARLPYAAPRPGDPAFQQPQVQGSTGSGSQAIALLCTLVVGAPAIVAGVLWLIDPASPWNWISLIVGVQAGLIALFIGIRAGGAVFDRRGPELLAFTMRH